MRTSIFNTIISIKDRHTLVYNALSGDFVLVKDNLLKLSNSCIEDLQTENESLFDQLCAAGILVEEDFDEISILRNRIMEADESKDRFILHVNPTLDCNFRCWYCYENHLTDSGMSTLTLEAVRRFSKHILNEKSELKFFDLAFFGGEPLLQFDHVVEPLITFIHKTCEEIGVEFSVQFTSNGYLLDSNKIDFLSKFPCSFQITMDGGKEYHNRTRFTKMGRIGTYDTILSNIIMLATMKIDVLMRINYTKANLKSVGSILADLQDIPKDCKKYIRIDLQRVWQDRNAENDEYDILAKEIRDQFRSEGFTVLTNYLLHDVRNSCYGDKLNHVLINYNGDVFGCTARDFIPNNRIGRLSDEGIIDYDAIVFNRRNQSKLFKKICRTCRIAPICGGGCKQKAYESMNNENCTFGYSEEDKDNIVLDIFEYSYLSNLHEE